MGTTKRKILTGNSNASFLGKEVGQTLEEMNAWESVEFDRFIEIGTWKGNLALYLFLLAKERGAEFYTFDIKDYEHTKIKNLVGFDKCFQKRDVFQIKWMLKELIEKKGRTVIFCDGGNKEREFNCFSRYLKKGDLIAVHDYGTEVHDENLVHNLVFYKQTNRIKIWQKK